MVYHHSSGGRRRQWGYFLVACCVGFLRRLIGAAGRQQQGERQLLSTTWSPGNASPWQRSSSSSRQLIAASSSPTDVQPPQRFITTQHNILNRWRRLLHLRLRTLRFQFRYPSRNQIKFRWLHKSTVRVFLSRWRGRQTNIIIVVHLLVYGQVTIIFVVSVGLTVCLFVCAEFFSAVFDPISIKLGHMLYVWV